MLFTHGTVARSLDTFGASLTPAYPQKLQTLNSVDITDAERKCGMKYFPSVDAVLADIGSLPRSWGVGLGSFSSLSHQQQQQFLAVSCAASTASGLSSALSPTVGGNAAGGIGDGFAIATGMYASESSAGAATPSASSGVTSAGGASGVSASGTAGSGAAAKGAGPAAGMQKSGGRGRLVSGRPVGKRGLC